MKLAADILEIDSGRPPAFADPLSHRRGRLQMCLRAAERRASNIAADIEELQAALAAEHTRIAALLADLGAEQ